LEPFPVCQDLGVRLRGRPGCVLADKSGEQRVGVPAIACVEF